MKKISLSKQNITFEEMKTTSSNMLFVNFIVIILAILSGYLAYNYYQDYLYKQKLETLVSEANQARSDRKYSEALSKYNERLKHFPEDLDATKGMAEIYFLKGDYQKSKENYERLKTIKSLDIVEIEDLGNAYIFLQENEKAMDLWDGKTLSPQNTYKLGNLFKKVDKIEKYIEILTSLGEYQEPRVKVLSQNISRITNEEITVIQKLPKISEDTDFTSFYEQVNEALIQRKQGKPEYADLIINFAYANINECILIKKNIPELRSKFNVKKFPIFQIDFLEGKCQGQLGNFPESIELIKKAIDADPANIEYREELALVYYKQKDKSLFVKTYEEIFTIDQNLENIQNYAALIFLLEDYDKALSIYESAIQREDAKSQKPSLAQKIIEINLLKKKNREICKRDDLLSIIDNKVLSNQLSIGICQIQNNEKPYASEPEILEFLTALQEGNNLKIEQILDRDTDGVITAYYKSLN